MNPDAAILALLRAVPHLNVHDGDVAVDKTQKVIRVPLPYVVFTSSPGYDTDKRRSGAVAGRVVEFQIQGAGEDRRQAKDVLEKARAALSRKRVNGQLIIRDDENQKIRRDDDYTRPGGEPIFYGVDLYAVAV